MEQWAKDYSRFLELEDLIPEWEQKIKEKSQDLRELKFDRDWKHVEVLNWEKPGFFQRLLGKVEEKKEAAWQEYRASVSAHEAAQREVDVLTAQVEAGRQELEALSGSRETYSLQEASLSLEERAAILAPAAMATAKRILEALEGARGWIQQDARRQSGSSRMVGVNSRKYEFLDLAKTHAKRLRALIELLPEGAVELGGYLKDPVHYVDSVTMEYKKLDMLNEAQRQVRAHRDWFRIQLEHAE